LSELGEKIRKATRSQPPPLGFVTSRTTPHATLVLAGIAKSAKDAAELAGRGADIVLVGAPGSPASPGDAEALKDACAGAWIDGKTDDESKAYREAGFDFVVFDPDRASATALLDEDVGYVIALPQGFDEVELRALEGFQLDAIHVGKIDNALTVRRQIALRRVFGLTRKPLMATVDAGISGTELQALRDTNVAVVAVEGAGNVERMRQAIDALPPRQRRRDDAERPFAMVPRAVPADDEDGDDDHDH
jgi:hypothetical protein